MILHLKGMNNMTNEKMPINDNELENVNGGLFGFEKNKKKKDVQYCPFCGGEGERMPINSDNPTQRYECQECHKEFY